MKQLIFSFIAVFSICSAIIGQDDATPASLYNDGLAALKAKEYGSALDLMQKALEKADPEEDKQVVNLAKKNGAIAAYYYGSALEDEDKNEEAITIHKQGIELNPDFYGNFVGLAKLHLGNEQYVDAVKNYLKAGNLRVKEGKSERAVTYFENVDKIIAIAYSKDQIQETLEACEIAMQENETAEVHYYKAKALADSGSEQEALTEALKAYEMGSDAEESKYPFTVAEIYEGMGNNDNAMVYYKKVGKGKYYDLAQYKINQSQ